MEEKLLDHGITYPQMGVLLAVSRGGPGMSQTDLARTLETDTTTITVICDSLEKKKLVTREPNPTDRRSKLILLTAAAAKKYPKTSELRGIVTVEDAIDVCRKTGLEGWALVEYAQKLVAEKMEYSYCNSWDMPKKAFAKGRGYCGQQAGALNAILSGLGLESRLVHAIKNYFPEEDLYSGHVWLRVRIGDTDLDVCPGDIDNHPGAVHFQSTSPVKNWNPFIAFFSYFGSAWINANRYARIEKE